MEKTPENYLVLLYYCYTKIDDPEQFRIEHHSLCLDLDLRGRIIIAVEGLNGTISGRVEACNKYMEIVKQDPRFKNLEFKVDVVNKMSFRKLNVRVKKEIVHSELFEVDPEKRTGVYIEPKDFRNLMEDEEVVFVDVRSRYEHQLGRFENAITFDIDNFRDFKDHIKELEPYKNKKVVTYCTGGIKCEKASAYLLEKGFENVFQLHGGIIKYGKETDGNGFEGSCYVFDKRLSTQINTRDPKIISKCFHCSKTSDRMVNCANPHCNNHLVLCDECGKELEGACSVACKENPDKRPYNPEGYFERELNGYNPKKDFLNSRKKENR
jgi:UPF0176 protein